MKRNVAVLAVCIEVKNRIGESMGTGMSVFHPKADVLGTGT